MANENDLEFKVSARLGDLSAIDDATRAIEQDTDAVEQHAKATEQDAAAANRAREEYKKLEAQRQIADRSAPTASGGTRDMPASPRHNVDLSREAALAEDMSRAVAPDRAASQLERLKNDSWGLYGNIVQVRNELRDLLNLPGERTRGEIERITELLGVLRANAQEARGFASRAAEIGEDVLSARLFAAATAAEKSAKLQSSYKPRASGTAETPEKPGITAAEATALGAGLRETGVQGGFVSSTLLRVASAAGASRIALFALGGFMAGGLVAAFAGLVGWIGKAATATPQFQVGLEGLRDSSQGLGDELNRTAKPLTDFVGRASGAVLGGFSTAIDAGAAALRAFNDAEGLSSDRTRDLDFQLAAIAGSTEAFTQRLVKTNAELREKAEALQRDIASMREAAQATDELAKAQQQLDENKVHLSAAQGKITPEQAQQQLAGIAAAAQTSATQRDVDLADAIAKKTGDASNEAAVKAAQATAFVAAKQQELSAAEAQPRETLDETRNRLETGARQTAMATHSLPILPTDDELQSANDSANAGANEQIAKIKEQLKIATDEAAKLKQQSEGAATAFQAASTHANTLRITLEAVKTGADAEAAGKTAQKKADDIREEMQSLAAAHDLEMAQIGDAEAAEGKRHDAEIAYLQAQLKLQQQLDAQTQSSEADRQQHLDEANAKLIETENRHHAFLDRQSAAQAKADARDGGPDLSSFDTPASGKIDARVVRSFDLSGNLVEDHGHALYGRDRMGGLLGPSQLPGRTGANRELNSRKGTDELDGATKPLQDAARATRQTSQGVTAVANELKGATGELSAAVKQLSGIAAKIQDVASSVKELAYKVNAIGAGR